MACFFCDDPTHKFQNCPKLKPQINIEEKLKEEMKRNDLESQIRYVRKDMRS